MLLGMPIAFFHGPLLLGVSDVNRCCERQKVLTIVRYDVTCMSVPTMGGRAANRIFYFIF